MIAPNLQRRGFTFVEVLLALTIGAILMAAIAAAMFAGADTIKVNSDFTQATQTARAAVQAINAAVRASYDCDVAAGRTSMGTTTGNILYVTPFNGTGGPGSEVAYVYDYVEKKLLLDTAPVHVAIDEGSLAGIRARMGATVFLLADKVEPAVLLINGEMKPTGFTGRYDKRKYVNPDIMKLATEELRLVNVQVHLKVALDTSVLELSDSVVPRSSYDQ